MWARQMGGGPSSGDRCRHLGNGEWMSWKADKQGEVPSRRVLLVPTCLSRVQGGSCWDGTVSGARRDVRVDTLVIDCFLANGSRGSLLDKPYYWGGVSTYLWSM